jgi:hypothetical protein
MNQVNIVKVQKETGIPDVALHTFCSNNITLLIIIMCLAVLDRQMIYRGLYLHRALLVALLFGGCLANCTLPHYVPQPTNIIAFVFT